jgi:transposase
MPSALQDRLPQGHLAYFIGDTVDSLNLGAFHGRYAAGGPRSQPLHPAMMVKALVYAYATGVFSSRKIARKLHEDVAFPVQMSTPHAATKTGVDEHVHHSPGSFNDLPQNWRPLKRVCRPGSRAFCLT